MLQLVPQQETSVDCGVFVCQIAEHLARDENLDFTQGHMMGLRLTMCNEIRNRTLLNKYRALGEPSIKTPRIRSTLSSNNENTSALLNSIERTTSENKPSLTASIAVAAYAPQNVAVDAGALKDRTKLPQHDLKSTI